MSWETYAICFKYASNLYAAQSLRYTLRTSLLRYTTNAHFNSVLSVMLLHKKGEFPFYNQFVFCIERFSSV